MAVFTKFYQFVQDVANKVHNLGTDNLKMMLTNTAPVLTNKVNGDLTEITAQGGYTAGGATVTISSSIQSTGIYRLIPSADVVWNGTGSGFGPFRYIVLYNSVAGPDATHRPLVAVWDFGSNVTINSGDTFTVSLDKVNGIITLQ